MTERMVTITPLHETASEEWSLEQFVKLVNDAAAAVPEEYRGRARVDLTAEDSYGCLSITYQRLETEAELQEREAATARWKSSREHEERRRYEFLKRKFEGQ